MGKPAALQYHPTKNEGLIVKGTQSTKNFMAENYKGRSEIFSTGGGRGEMEQVRGEKTYCRGDAHALQAELWARRMGPRGGPRDQGRGRRDPGAEQVPLPAARAARPRVRRPRTLPGAGVNGTEAAPTHRSPK